MAPRFTTTSNYGGGSLIGYVTLSYKEMVKVFGTPNGEGDGYKVSTSWHIVDNITGNFIEVYDYKETKLYDKSYPSVRALPVRSPASTGTSEGDRRISPHLHNSLRNAWVVR